MSGMKEDAEKRGNLLKIQGEKILNNTGMLESIFGFGKSQKYEDASQSFSQAGNSYKVANNWQSAGEMFLKAADINQMVSDSSQTDTINYIVEAGNSFKKISPVDAINAFQKAIQLYSSSGRYDQAAKYYKEIAEIFETDGNMDEALNSYQSAADIFSSNNAKTKADPCLLKIATISCEKDDFTRAGDIYETIGRTKMESDLGKYAAKGNFFHCLLCHLASGDSVCTREKLDAFSNIDFSFASSREGEFIVKILEVILNIFIIY
jgi:alpha-soluble NSF attachment protein